MARKNVAEFDLHLFVGKSTGTFFAVNNPQSSPLAEVSHDDALSFLSFILFY